jgi:hypothetical protein
LLGREAVTVAVKWVLRQFNVQAVSALNVLDELAITSLGHTGTPPRLLRSN